MASEVSTIQSLKAVDAWIDVINANINGGVRTAFKASRLKFSGSNTDIARTGNATSLPLQFPEPGLTTANTIIDFSQGAITASTESTHLAIQGEGFFLLASPDAIDIDGVTGGDAIGGDTKYSPTAKFLVTRDGEFRTDANGYLRTSFGYYLVSVELSGGVPMYSTTQFGASPTSTRPIFNNIDNPNFTATTANAGALLLTEFLNQRITRTVSGSLFGGPGPASLIKVSLGKQSLQYSQYGSTVFELGYKTSGTAAMGTINPGMTLQLGSSSDATVLSKSLEASNASMTQSVPELSLAQKLFSALTKVLQTKQTNVDGVLNLVR
jgi:flagellar hook protein FlgE